MGDFQAGRDRWLARLGNLRDTVRQELVTRQLAGHLPAPPARVLDIGCGQGTQALRLAAAGHEVVGIDPSPEMLDAFRGRLADEPAEVAARVALHLGDGVAAPDLAGREAYDVALLHGVLMYLDDPRPTLGAAAETLRPGGLLSLLVRNGSALAMRPGLRGDWAAARAAFDQTTYRNLIGVTARADTVADLSMRLAGLGLELEAWYGVRLFSDVVSVDTPAPTDPAELAALLDAEDRAGRTDPYRGVAALLHVVARKAPKSVI